VRRKATLCIFAALIAVFALEGARGAIGDEGALLSMGALPNDGSLHHEYWRLIAYSALHLNYAHIVLNLALLWWVGSIVERRVGSTALGIAYFAFVLVAGGGITLLHMSHPRPGASVGASGGLFGLLACALMLLYRRDASAFGQRMRVRLWLWVVLCAGFGASLLPGVSLMGHASGFAAGLLVGWFLPVAQSPKPARHVVGVEGDGADEVHDR
jgi:rhomboid protease GluP